MIKKFFVEENVPATVADSEINIFNVKSNFKSSPSAILIFFSLPCYFSIFRFLSLPLINS